jgi:hypothetical protein
LGEALTRFLRLPEQKTWANFAQLLTVTKRKAERTIVDFQASRVAPYKPRVLSGIISSNLFVLVRCKPIPRDNLSRVVVEQYIRLRSLVHS